MMTASIMTAAQNGTSGVRLRMHALGMSRLRPTTVTRHHHGTTLPPRGWSHLAPTPAGRAAATPGTRRTDTSVPPFAAKSSRSYAEVHAQLLLAGGILVPPPGRRRPDRSPRSPHHSIAALPDPPSRLTTLT